MGCLLFAPLQKRLLPINLWVVKGLIQMNYQNSVGLLTRAQQLENQLQRSFHGPSLRKVR